MLLAHTDYIRGVNEMDYLVGVLQGSCTSLITLSFSTPAFGLALYFMNDKNKDIHIHTITRGCPEMRSLLLMQVCYEGF